MAKIRLTLSILALVSSLALIFTSCSDSGTDALSDEPQSSSSAEPTSSGDSPSSSSVEPSSSESGTAISGDSNSEALNKLLGTWINHYEAIEFSKNGYREYEYYDGETYDYNDEYQLSVTITDGYVSGKITGLCLIGTCVNVQDKQSVKNHIKTYYTNTYLAEQLEDCKEYPRDFGLESASQCTESVVKSDEEQDCEYNPERYGFTSESDCKWNNIMNYYANDDYEEMEENNWILFFYFYNLDGDKLTTSCSSKQEAIKECYPEVYTKQGT